MMKINCIRGTDHEFLKNQERKSCYSSDVLNYNILMMGTSTNVNNEFS